MKGDRKEPLPVGNTPDVWVKEQRLVKPACVQKVLRVYEFFSYVLFHVEPQDRS